MGSVGMAKGISGGGPAFQLLSAWLLSTDGCVPARRSESGGAGAIHQDATLTGLKPGGHGASPGVRDCLHLGLGRLLSLCIALAVLMIIPVKQVSLY